MEFLDEYKCVMERYAGLRAYGSVCEEGDTYYIDYGRGFYARLWYENGGYSFAEEERGNVWPGGFFSSQHIELTQKVMLNYTVSILRHSLASQCWVFRPKLTNSRPVGCFKILPRGVTLLLMGLMVSTWTLRPRGRVTACPLPGSTT